MDQKHLNSFGDFALWFQRILGYQFTGGTKNDIMSTKMPRVKLDSPLQNANPATAYAVLTQLRRHFSQQELAAALRVTAKTIARWEKQECSMPLLILPVLEQLIPTHNPNPRDHDFTFIDLFAGIGGMRLGFEDNGGKCVFTSEWNEFSQRTYLANFNVDHEIIGDIVPYDANKIPDHDVLLAGFPCQPFSIAGVSKKNSLGVAHGFECTTQGTLFFDVARIISTKRPKAFLLENVKNLVSHDKGRTFSIILQTLREELGYHIEYRVIDAKGFTPQHRERIMIVGFREKTEFSFNSFIRPDIKPIMKDVLHPEDGSEPPEGDYTSGERAEVNPKYNLSNKLWKYLQGYAEKHKAQGNGFGFGLVDENSTSRTLSARYYKDGSEILVSRGKSRNPRRLTPRECARLMGFPDSFKLVVSDTQAYKQFGNSVVVPVIREVARLMKPFIIKMIEQEASTGHGN